MNKSMYISQEKFLGPDFEQFDLCLLNSVYLFIQQTTFAGFKHSSCINMEKNGTYILLRTRIFSKCILNVSRNN